MSFDLQLRALAFLAAVHQGDALAEGGVENGLAFFDFHLDADGFKTNVMYGGA